MFPVKNATKLRGIPLSATKPVNGQALVYNSASNLWVPGVADQYATVAITAAQIKALSSAPVSLVAAQGAGTIIEFVSAMVNTVAGTLYVNGSGGAPNLVISVGVPGTGISVWNDPASSNLATFLRTNLGGNWTGQLLPSLSAASFVSFALIDVSGSGQNQALQFGQSLGATRDLVTGTGTMSIRVTYRVHTGLS